jgi:hypothetical protein
VISDVAPHFPELIVELIDVDQVEPPPSVFAVPTYLLNDQVISLGNPSRHELGRRLSLVSPAQCA